MSTAVYPQGMRSAMPASGYNHHSTYFNKQYITWKGTGPFSNPVGTAPGHIRPLTNNDPGNVFQTGFGLARPIKHFRKGRVIPPQPITGVPNLIGKDPHNQSITIDINENALINYNINRFVASSKGTSLGGGFGGSGLLNEMQDKPGAFIVKLNPPNELGGVSQLDSDCKTCEGVGIVASYYPNNTYLTENPEPNVTNRVLCCNEEYKAKRRAIYASTNLKKNYYTTTKQYLQNRCQTYNQKVFNFKQPYSTEISNELIQNGITPEQIALAKPGSPIALANTYVANCFPNLDIYDATEYALVGKLLDILFNKGIITKAQLDEYLTLENAYNFDTLFNYIINLPGETGAQAIATFNEFINNPYWGVPFSGPSNPNGCKLTVYKPNNYQFAQQGAVDSSTRMLKLNVNTITTNAHSISNSYENVLKNKVPGCNTPTIFQFQNKKSCFYKDLQSYQNPKSHPSPYRYFPATVTSSNHFSQSPNTYNTTSGSAQYVSR
jgi:hypothetical protein